MTYCGLFRNAAPVHEYWDSYETLHIMELYWDVYHLPTGAGFLPSTMPTTCETDATAGWDTTTVTTNHPRT